MKQSKWLVFVLLFALGIGSAFPTEDPSVLLEKAIYTEEILGDLGKAVDIYRQVIAATDSSRLTAALATYRLGKCYQKMGRTKDARAAFDRLSKEYPEQQALISKIPTIPKENEEHLQAPRTYKDYEDAAEAYLRAYKQRAEASQESRELADELAAIQQQFYEHPRIPWADGEVLEFVNSVKNPSEYNSRSKAATFRMDSSELNGKAVWRFEKLETGLMTGQRTDGYCSWYDFTKVYMDASDLIPVKIHSIIARSIWGPNTHTIRYTPGLIESSRISISVRGKSTTEKNRLALDRKVLDFNQIEMFIRTLPLRVGYRTVLQVASQSAIRGSSDAAPVDTVNISVPVREKITVPAGVFDCYKVIRTYNKSVTISWISADENAYIVKIDGSDFQTLELKSTEKFDSTKPVVFKDRELDIEISAPSQWYIRRLTSEPAIHLIEPEYGAEGMLRVLGNRDPDNRPISLDTLIDREIELSLDRQLDYSVLPESRKAITISGRPGIRYLAEYKGIDSRAGPSFFYNRDFIEYAHYFTKSDKVYRLVFRVPHDQFDGIKSVLDSIAGDLIVP